MNTKIFLSLFLLLGFTASAQSQNDMDFSNYIIAITWQPSQCQRVSGAQECSLEKYNLTGKSHLTAHGLWPSIPNTLQAANVATSAWNSLGCGIFNGFKAFDKPSDSCEYSLSLQEETANLLSKYMPGSTTSTCLHKYEYAKHAQCFSFQPDEYFLHLASITEQLRESPFGQFLASNIEKQVSIDTIVSTFYTAFQITEPIDLVVSCGSYKNKNEDSYFYEIQFPIKKHNIAQKITNTSFPKGTVKYTSKCNASKPIYIDNIEFEPS